MITIIGNGESRKDIDIDKIPQGKVGCNGIYLYNKVDLICGMDKFWRDKISKETHIPLLSRKNNTSFQTVLQLYKNGKWMDTTCPYRAYCSGITALDFICYTYPKEDIYMIGFDFGYNGEFVNHIYKGHKFGPRINGKAQNENIFLKQYIETIKRYPRRNIYWVNDSINDLNLNQISIRDYLNIISI